MKIKYRIKLRTFFLTSETFKDIDRVFVFVSDTIEICS